MGRGAQDYFYFKWNTDFFKGNRDGLRVDTDAEIAAYQHRKEKLLANSVPLAHARRFHADGHSLTAREQKCRACEKTDHEVKAVCCDLCDKGAPLRAASCRRRFRR